MLQADGFQLDLAGRHTGAKATKVKGHKTSIEPIRTQQESSQQNPLV